MNLILPGAIAKRAVADAEANVGVQEQGGNNRGRYVETYLRSVGLQPGDPWCAAFVHYRLVMAALALGAALPADFPRSGYCPDYKQWAMARDLWIPVSDPARQADVRRGDVCLFYFPAKARVAHIGHVAAASSWGCVTVEGNTGPEAGTEVNREGDGVFRKNRDWAEFGQYGGFVRLPW